MPKTKGSANAIGVIYGNGDAFGETTFLGMEVVTPLAKLRFLGASF